MAKNPFIPAKPTNKPNFVDVKHSAGILDDHKTAKVMHTKELYIQGEELLRGDHIWLGDNTWNGESTWDGRINTIYADNSNKFLYLTEVSGSGNAGITFVVGSTPGRMDYDGHFFSLSHPLDVTGPVYQDGDFSTPTRALDTIYQNTTGHTIVVIGSANCLYLDDNMNLAYFDCQTGSSSPPTTLNQRGGCTASAFVVTANSAFLVSYPFNFEVPAGHYYRIKTTITGIGAVVLDKWREVNK